MLVFIHIWCGDVIFFSHDICGALKKNFKQISSAIVTISNFCWKCLIINKWLFKKKKTFVVSLHINTSKCVQNYKVCDEKRHKNLFGRKKKSTSFIKYNVLYTNFEIAWGNNI